MTVVEKVRYDKDVQGLGGSPEQRKVRAGQTR